MSAAGEKSLSIIIPSFNDPRVLQAVDSVRAFDDVNAVSIVLIDGGSKPELVAEIADRMTGDDFFVSERDKGIFDALNKGLEALRTPYIGWLGSDDSFSGQVKASDVLQALETHDVFVARTAHVRGDRVMRITPSWPSANRLARLVFNNPHFSTFGRSALFKLERFSLSLRGADIEYFLKIFARNPKVCTSPKIATFMEVGGYSNSSYKLSAKMHAELFKVHKEYMPSPAVSAALTAKLAYKALSSAYHRVFPRRKADIAS